jgi:hypothetical protein
MTRQAVSSAMAGFGIATVAQANVPARKRAIPAKVVVNTR